MRNPKKVVVAMSGGVDSSVAAALMKRDGYEVVGVTLVLNPWDDGSEADEHIGQSALTQARAVAIRLGIEHHTIDRTSQFDGEVLRPAWEEYNRGRTPSPCVVCNRRLKFQTLLSLAGEFGAQKIATGHYARIEHDEQRQSYRLFRGLDHTKDQSYFLFALSDDQLKSTLFPLGELKKSKVRVLADKMDFENAQRPESQDACFVLKNENFAEALRTKYGAPTRPGLVVDKDGNVLGEHQGIHKFTVGQRKGLGISLGKRAWVKRIDGNDCRVFLSDDPAELKGSVLTASDVVWVGGEKPILPKRCHAQIQSQHKPARAVASLREDGGLTLSFDEPQNAIAPGQAVVLYDGDRVLGGGWISG